jgi:hypothetical protein
MLFDYHFPEFDSRSLVNQKASTLKRTQESRMLAGPTQGQPHDDNS